MGGELDLFSSLSAEGAWSVTELTRRARAVVEAGWDLNELRPAAVSLEEIFLQLTQESAAPADSKEAKEVVP